MTENQSEESTPATDPGPSAEPDQDEVLEQEEEDEGDDEVSKVKLRTRWPYGSFNSGRSNLPVVTRDPIEVSERTAKMIKKLAGNRVEEVN